MSSTYKQLTTQFGNVDATENAQPFISFLDKAAAILREGKESGYEMLRLREGQHVLDVGCGTGDDARRLAELVGSPGFTMGLDSSKSMAAEAKRRGSTLGKRVEFAVGDAQHLPMDDSMFDACRAERVLQHVESPALALSEMVRVVRPGGRVMVFDADHGMAAINARDRATTSAILSTFQRNLRNPWIGRQLPGLFRAAGLRDVETRIVPFPFTELGVARALVDFEGLARQCTAEGVLTATAASQWLLDLEALANAAGFLLVLMGFLVAGWK
jgi:ubiquinone/menaquinone biosynthesis C-methylase UbiE